MTPFIILYRYTKPGEKNAGPIQQYRVYARDLREAWSLAQQYGGYPGFKLIDVVPA